MHGLFTRTRAAWLALLAVGLLSVAVRAETFQTPTLSAPPPPPAMTIPGATPRILTLGADDRALREAIDTRLGKMIAELREARAAMLAVETGEPAREALRRAYAGAGASERGAIHKGGPMALLDFDLAKVPPIVNVDDADYLSGDAIVLNELAQKFAGFYDAYLFELEAYRKALPSRPAFILTQLGVKPESLARDKAGGAILPKAVRTGLKLEYRYLDRGHKTWKIVEAAYRAEFFARVQGRIIGMMAARARETQILAGQRQSVRRMAFKAHEDYLEAGLLTQPVIDAYARAMNRFMPRLQARADCHHSLTYTIHQMIGEPATPGRLYFNPDVFASHLGGKFYMRPGEPDGFGEALVAMAVRPSPECILTPTDAAETGEAQTTPEETIGGIPLLGGDCAECDDAKVALTAIEMSLMPLLREEALLKDKLRDGESADKLLKKYVQADSAAERYASNLDTEARLDADPLTGQKSVLGFWSQVLEESKPTAEQEAYLARLSASCPLSLILAKAGIPGGAALLDWCANGIVEAEKDLRRLHPFEGMNIHYRKDYSEFEELRNEVLAQEKELRSVPPERRRPKLTAEQEAALQAAVRRALESDPKYAELVDEADEARLQWELRDAAERRLRALAEEIAAYEKDRLDAKAAYDDCMKQCKARLP